MNKNINTVIELTEKELECVTGGRRIVGGGSSFVGAGECNVEYVSM